MEKTIGVLGGMGPLATVDMMHKIILNDPAPTDQAHLHVIVDCDPKIPDRTAAILEGGADPVPRMVASARRLVQAGADVIVMACNTAHYFYDQVQASIPVPILHMQREAAAFAVRAGYRKLGLLASTGTVRTGLYQACFHTFGVDIVTPDDALQASVMQGIRAVKAGDLDRGAAAFQAAGQALLAAGAEAVIAGCTEIPIVLRSGPELCVMDPTEVTAQAAVRWAATGGGFAEAAVALAAGDARGAD
ncbi:MAG: amino acid racemase [Alicyclobacillus sp.]|nr:amino acid racemase [Alicyclobacillus sp.]